jgi:hypothetical protein
VRRTSGWGDSLQRLGSPRTTRCYTVSPVLPANERDVGPRQGSFKSGQFSGVWNDWWPVAPERLSSPEAAWIGLLEAFLALPEHFSKTG